MILTKISSIRLVKVTKIERELTEIIIVNLHKTARYIMEDMIS